MATDSPKNEGGGDGSGLFKSPAEQVSQIPWYEEIVHAFEASANEIAHPSSQTKKDQPS